MASNTVLMICGVLFPPNYPAGTLRIERLVQHLPEFGVRPIVLAHRWETPHVDSYPFPVIRASFGSTGELLHLKKTIPRRTELVLPKWRHKLNEFISLGESFTYDDECTYAAYLWLTRRVLPNLIETHRIDAVFSTFNPFINHRLASFVATHWNIPWIADYRDLFTLNPFHHLRLGYHKQLQGKWIATLEKRALRHASVITTASDYLSQQQKAFLGEKPIVTIHNSFDLKAYHARNMAEQQTSFVEKEREARITIGYFGILYPGHQNIEPFFKGLSTFPRRDQIRIVVRSPHHKMFQSAAERYRLLGQCDIDRSVPKTEAERLEATVDAFTIFDFAEAGNLTSKFFNSLTYNKPILIFPFSEKHLSAEHLNGFSRRYRLGNVIASEQDLHATLTHCLERKAARGTLFPYYLEEDLLQFSSRNMTEKMVSVFNEYTK